LKTKNILLIFIIFLGAISGISISIPLIFGNPDGTNLIISEILYDAPNSDTTEEWIEIHNPTTTAINIDGWTLSDNVGTNTLPSYSIEAGGYFIFARDSAAFNALYGFSPDSDAMTLALGNTGDQLILKDNNGVEVDFVAWESYVTGWTVSAIDKTIRRISDANGEAIDTDSPSDWENSGSLGDPGAGYGTIADVTPPTVTITNPADGATVSGTVTITFDATDENGISTTRILIDGVERSTSTSYSWDTTLESEGTHIIRSEATDPSSNLGFDEITVTVNNNPVTDPIEVYYTDPLAGLPWFDKPELQEGNISTGLVGMLDSANTSINAALYHLDWQPVIDALIAAHNRGVTVQIAAHDDNLAEFQPLIDAGISVQAVPTSYIMHNKFFIVDGLTVWTGSYNPTITGTIHNANDAVKITSIDLATAFQAEFDQLYAGISGKSKTDNNEEIVTVGNTQVEVYFAPEDSGRTRLIELIDSTTTSLYISMFYLTDDTIYDAIVRARDRGVTIKSVLDYRAWFNAYSEADDIISWGGGIIDANPGVYHHKFAVFDGAIVWTGSTNWSGSGFDDNDENSIVIHDTTIASNYIARTEEYYQDAVNYDASPTEAPRIVTRHYSGWAGANFITWRPHMDGNVANDLIEKYLVWRWNPTSESYDLIQEVNGATGYYSDADVVEGVTYYYVISSIARGGYDMTTCSTEFAQIGAGGDQPVIYPPRNYYQNFGNDIISPIVTVTNPADGETVSGWVDITFTADDSSYISEWEVYVDGVLKSQGNSRYGWDTTSETDGSHTIVVKAKDVFGNWGESTITVTVDNSAYIAVNPDFSSVKIMTYNIEASGENPEFIDVIKEENPDIFVLVETGDWDDKGNLTFNAVLVELNEYFVNELPYFGTITQGINSKYSGIAIFSRFPIISDDQIPIVTLDDGTRYDVSHDFLYTNLQIGTSEIHLIGAHLKASTGASNELKREKAQEGIINFMDSLGNVSIFYMGDLNSFSPEDTGDLAPNGDLGYGPVNMTINPLNPHYPEVQSYTDAFRTLNPTDPGYTYYTAPYESRIDFIFASSFLSDEMLFSTTGDTASASLGSDHYSLDVTMDFSMWDDTTSEIKVLISEVFYDTPGVDSSEEWIELFNPTSQAIDLSGWTISDNAGTFIIPTGTIIAAGSFLVIARDSQGFFALYGFNPDISGLSLSLSNTGDKLTLKDASGLEMDFVSWENYVTGWDITASTGSTIERSPPSVDTDLVVDWIVTTANGNPGTSSTPP